jgi:hypothetical protein
MECYLRIDKAQPKDLKNTFLYVSDSRCSRSSPFRSLPDCNQQRNNMPPRLWGMCAQATSVGPGLQEVHPRSCLQC